MTKSIRRNKTIPCNIIQVFEGGRQFKQDNNLLAKFEYYIDNGDGTYTDSVLSHDHLDRLTEHQRNNINPKQRDGDTTLQLQYISSEAVAPRKDVNARIANGDHNSPLSQVRDNNKNNSSRIHTLRENSISDDEDRPETPIQRRDSKTQTFFITDLSHPKVDLDRIDYHGNEVGNEWHQQ